MFIIISRDVQANIFKNNIIAMQLMMREINWEQSIILFQKDKLCDNVDTKITEWHI